MGFKGFVELILRKKEYGVKVYPKVNYSDVTPDSEFIHFSFFDEHSLLFDVLDYKIRDAIWRAMDDLNKRENIYAVRHIES